MTIRTLDCERRTLHGHFSRDLPPILTIDPGDTVHYTTLDAGWGLEAPRLDGTQRNLFEPRVEELDMGHALIGPLEIRGAQPGMVLEIKINDIRPGPYGWTWAGNWPVLDGDADWLDLGDGEITITWVIDADKKEARNRLGNVVALRPFMGVMGMPPAEPGVHPTAPPRPCGGNIDCRELVVGSSLFLPVTVPGALFSVGDGHALQGDGEVSRTAIECPMEHVDLSFFLHDGPQSFAPWAETPAGLLTLGFDSDLNAATRMALRSMLDLMQERFGLPRPQALALASLLVDMRITQIVNGVSGVHAILPREALRSLQAR